MSRARLLAVVTMDLLERLRMRDWRLSAQRRAVAEVLAGDHVHLTAEQVHERARDLVPEISRATVYSTLNELVAMGDLMVVDTVQGPKRYDPNVANAHDHFVCDRCGTIRDIPRAAARAARHRCLADGSLVDRVDVTYHGLCPSCARLHEEPDPDA